MQVCCLMCLDAPSWRSTSNEYVLRTAAVEGLHLMNALLRMDTPKRQEMLGSDATFVHFPRMPIYVRCVHVARSSADACGLWMSVTGLWLVCIKEPFNKHN